ncbi:DUF6152 family protein [Candidatus Rariloculus sp.]|uniref:DUF6152 family protein n=1 Tax=Candidatus Rariloculus sp. TaxID=3101265 RepID=UPI003D10A401
MAAAAALLMVGHISNGFAHHSFASEFDANRPIELTGIVKEMRFSNPHSWIYIEVTIETGEVQEWAIEGAAPNALLRRGFSRNSLPAGTEIHVRGFQARDRTFRAAGRDIVLEDGSRLLVGSAGIGAPESAGDED